MMLKFISFIILLSGSIFSIRQTYYSNSLIVSGFSSGAESIFLAIVLTVFVHFAQTGAAAYFKIQAKGIYRILAIAVLVFATFYSIRGSLISSDVAIERANYKIKIESDDLLRVKIFEQSIRSDSLFVANIDSALKNERPGSWKYREALRQKAEVINRISEKRDSINSAIISRPDNSESKAVSKSLWLVNLILWIGIDIVNISATMLIFDRSDKIKAKKIIKSTEKPKSKKQKMIEELKSGNVNISEFARKWKTSRVTVYRYLEEINGKEKKERQKES